MSDALIYALLLTVVAANIAVCVLASFHAPNQSKSIHNSNNVILLFPDHPVYTGKGRGEIVDFQDLGRVT